MHAPCGLTINHSDGWTATEVDGANSNIWEITLELPSQVNDSTFNIEWNPQENPTPPIIKKLNIIQPIPSSHNLRAFIGGFTRLAEIKEVVVSRVASGEGGFVWVNALLTGDLGPVYGPSFLDANLVTGDVNGPIVCFGHWRKAGISLLSQHGSLKCDVGIFPPPCIVPTHCTLGYVPIQGHINWLDFRRGTIGENGKPVTILADDFIDEVYATEIHANIRGTDTDPSNTDFDSFVGVIGSVISGFYFAGSGDFAGDFTGEIRAEENIPLAHFQTLRFEGEMRGAIWIQQGNDDIRIARCDPAVFGTIVYGARNPFATGPLWGGATRIRPDDCSSPPPSCNLSTGCQIVLNSGSAGGYNPPRTAASLGGGSVGQPPFRRHDNDCFPPAASEPFIFTNMNERPGPDKPIKMRHYGPVDWVTGEGVPAPYKVERRRITGCNTTTECWMNMTGCFTLSREANNTVVTLTPQTAYDLPRGYEYRISLQEYEGTRVLRCALPHREISDAPEVFNYPPLVFWICDEPGDGDADDDGDVDFNDITIVLANFGEIGCPVQGDANRNGAINFDDVTNVLANWSMQYTCGSGQQSFLALGGGDGFTTMDAMEEPPPGTAASAAMAVLDALMQMGYTSIEAFTNAIAQMTDQDRNAEIRRLGQLLSGE